MRRRNQDTLSRIATSSRERLIVFTRYPEAGKTKKRLIPELGPDGAADLQRRMAEHAICRVRDVIESRGASIEIRYEGGNQTLMSQWLGGNFLYREQRGKDLGERMLTAFVDAFQGGVKRVLLVGTDCPDITSEIVERGFQELGRFDVVLGPAADGGYYLIGLKKSYPELFYEAPWGTDEVLNWTLRIACFHGLSTRLLDCLSDVDRPEDLHIWNT